MASEIQLTSQDNSEINLTLNESPSSIDVNFQEGSTINSVVQEPSVISTTVTQTLSQIAVVNQYMSEPVLSVRVRGDNKGPQTGDVVLDAASVPHFHPDTFYAQGYVIIYNYKLYEAKEDFTSSSTFDEDDWIPISSNLSFTSVDNSVDITKIGDNVDLSVSRIVNAEKVRAEEIEANLAHLIEELDLKILRADWNEDDSDSWSYIENKPTKLSQFENDEHFVSENQVYLKNQINLSNTIITLDDATVKTYDILTLASN